jgi:hypothetical protein
MSRHKHDHKVATKKSELTTSIAKVFKEVIL